MWIILIRNEEYPLYCSLWRPCLSSSIRYSPSYKANSPIPNDPITTREYVAQRHLPLQRGELSPEVPGVGSCVCSGHKLGSSIRGSQTTFENVDHLLNTWCIDGFDRLQQVSVWFHFGTRVRLVACFGLSREVIEEFRKVSSYIQCWRGEFRRSPRDRRWPSFSESA